MFDQLQNALTDWFVVWLQMDPSAKRLFTVKCLAISAAALSAAFAKAVEFRRPKTDASVSAGRRTGIRFFRIIPKSIRRLAPRPIHHLIVQATTSRITPAYRLLVAFCVLSAILALFCHLIESSQSVQKSAAAVDAARLQRRMAERTLNNVLRAATHITYILTTAQEQAKTASNTLSVANSTYSGVTNLVNDTTTASNAIYRVTTNITSLASSVTASNKAIARSLTGLSILISDASNVATSLAETNRILQRLAWLTLMSVDFMRITLDLRIDTNSPHTSAIQETFLSYAEPVHPKEANDLRHEATNLLVLPLTQHKKISHAVVKKSQSGVTLAPIDSSSILDSTSAFFFCKPGTGEPIIAIQAFCHDAAELRFNTDDSELTLRLEYRIPREYWRDDGEIPALESLQNAWFVLVRKSKSMNGELGFSLKRAAVSVRGISLEATNTAAMNTYPQNLAKFLYTPLAEEKLYYTLGQVPPQ